MLNNISWYQYILYSFSVVGIYYCCVLIAYYRKDLSKGITQRSSSAHEKGKTAVSQKTTTKKSTLDFSNPDSIDQLFSQALELSDAIKGIYQEASYNEGNTDDLLYQLKKKISNYKALAQTPFMVAINNLIVTEAEKHQFEIKDKKGITALWVGGNP
ncbi:MAG: hypothetical protein ACTHMM_12165 [Agriterribacter sp.]